MRSTTLLTAVIAAAAGSASAATVTISEISAQWTGIQGGMFHNIDNTPNSQGWVTAKWGLPATIIGPQSGLGFQATDTPLTVAAGDLFTLGTLRHFNRPIWDGTEAHGAGLQIGLTFSDPAGLAGVFAFSFDILETPNIRHDGVSDSDIISFPAAFSNESVVLHGVAYTLELVGFLDGGSLVDRFISPEFCDSDAQILARLSVTGVPTPPSHVVPAPAAALTGGLGLGLLGVRRRR